MQRSTPKSSWQALIKLLTQFDTTQIDTWVAFRNTLGVTLPLVIGYLLHEITPGIAASLGALVVSYSDGADPYAQRARRMLRSTLLCTVAVTLALLSPQHTFLAIVFVTSWAFFVGLFVVLGSQVADLAVLSLVMFVIFATREASLRESLLGGFLCFSGGLFQTFLALILWPLRRYEPERRELGKLFMELARLAAMPIWSKNTTPLLAQSLRAHEFLAGLSHHQGVESSRYRSLLSQAERIRLSLVSLSRLRKRIQRESLDGREAKLIGSFVQTSAKSLGFTAEILLTEEPSESAAAPLRELETLLQTIRAENGQREKSLLSAALRDTVIQMESLTGQLRAVHDLAQRTTPEGSAAFREREAKQPWSLRFSGTAALLWANFNLNSVGFRHAIRLATCIAVGELLSHTLKFERAYWLPMTIGIVLKPEYSATLSRGLLRILGSIVGLILATGLFYFLSPGLGAQIIIFAAFVFLLRWLGTANYGIFALAVSGCVVLMAAATGVAPKPVIVARAISTLAGGCIALFAFWIWPTSGEPQIAKSLATLIDDYRAYFLRVAESCVGPLPGSSDELDRLRVASRVSRSNFQGLVNHFYAEPGTTQEERALLSSILSNANRLAHASMALDAGGPQDFSIAARETFEAFYQNVGKTLTLLSEALRGAQVPKKDFPQLREDHERFVAATQPPLESSALIYEETDRLTNALSTLREQAITWIRTHERSHE